MLATDERELSAGGPDDRRRRRVVARTALRIALARATGRPAASLELALGPGGKPVLTEGRGLEFSVSTTGELCIVALARGAPLGVDVERLVPRDGLERIVDTRFAPSEAARIAELDGEDRLRAFYSCWTRKEAYLKAIGSGLARPLREVVVSVDDEAPTLVAAAGDDPKRWSLGALDLGAEAVGSLAVRAPPPALPPLIGARELPLELAG